MDKEVKLGRNLGPIDDKPISNMRVSPVVLVDKLDKGWRLITHLSFPNQFSVDKFIDSELCTVKLLPLTML